MSMKTRIFLLVLLAAVVSACGASPATEVPPDNAQGPIYIDSAQLLVLESFPIQLQLVLQGNLPTPCHLWHYEIAPANAQGQIHVSLYTTVDPLARCVQVLQPFDETISIPLEGLQDGSYEVWLNGELVGSFNYPG